MFGWEQPDLEMMTKSWKIHRKRFGKESMCANISVSLTVFQTSVCKLIQESGGTGRYKLRTKSGKKIFVLPVMAIGSGGGRNFIATWIA